MDNKWKVISRVKAVRFPCVNTNDIVTITVMSDGINYSSFSSSPLDLYDLLQVINGGYPQVSNKIMSVNRYDTVIHDGNMKFKIKNRFLNCRKEE